MYWNNTGGFGVHYYFEIIVFVLLFGDLVHDVETMYGLC